MIMAVVLIFRHRLPELGIIGDNHPAFTGGNGLDRIKREGAAGTERTQMFAVYPASSGLRGILKYRNAMLCGNINDCLRFLPWRQAYAQE